MRFMAYNTLRLPFYDELAQRLKAGATFCDAGCCFGQEIRHLVYTHKLDSSKFYGFDLELQFLDTGYELFRDKDSLKASFRAGNILDAPAEGSLGDFQSKMDIIFCSSFLHVFGWDQMIEAAVHLVSLSRPYSGSIICGKQLGNLNCGEAAMPSKSGTMYRHNVESMGRFWNEVGEKTGTKWTLEAGLYEGLFELAQNKSHSWSDPNQRMLWWKAMRQ